MRRQALLAACVIAIAGLCAVQMHAQGRAIPADTQISLTRSSCLILGACPVYSVVVDATGSIVYVGSSGVRVSGRQTAQVDLAGVQRLLELSDRIGFFDLDANYERLAISDRPATLVTVTSAGRTKTVRDYTGAPASLKAFERTIDDVTRSQRWISYDAEELRDTLARGPMLPVSQLQGLLATAARRDDRELVQLILDVAPNRAAFLMDFSWVNVRSAATARMLVQAGANPNEHDRRGQTPLYQAGSVPAEVTAVLLGSGARVELRSERGGSALWNAAGFGNADVVELLLAAGADPFTMDGDDTVLDYVRAQRRMINMATMGVDAYRPDVDRTIALLEGALAQQASQASRRVPAVVLRRAAAPRYPSVHPAARPTAHVDVIVNVRPDGTVDSAAVANGPALFQSAALDAAMASTFECRGCDQTMPYALVVAFNPGEPRRSAKCLWLWKCR
jgi:hypothetical protein